MRHGSQGLDATERFVLGPNVSYCKWEPRILQRPHETSWQSAFADASCLFRTGDTSYAACVPPTQARDGGFGILYRHRLLDDEVSRWNDPG